MLEQYLEIIKVQDSSCSTTDDAKTLAAARTSAGHLIQVSLRLAEPPALSRVFLRIPDGLEEERSRVLAAHGDSLLIQVFIRQEYESSYTADHLVYDAGAAAANPPRPPSLSLLPRLPSSNEVPYFVPTELSDGAAGLLRRGDDELVVAELSTDWWDDEDEVGELYMLRSNEWKWKYHRFEIREAWDLPSVRWDTVVPVDDRLLCWVSLCRGVMLIDVFEEPPVVQYVPLPSGLHGYPRVSNRNVCTTAGGSALKLIDIFGRCCCGAATPSCGCERSRHAYTIHTWTMRIDGGGGGDMVWVNDGIVDATELWALDAYKDLPCRELDRPVASFDEPEVVCFRQRDTSKYGNRSPICWQIMVNMKTKTIRSVSRHEQEVSSHELEFWRDDWEDRCKLIPSNVSYSFNSLTVQTQMDDDEKPQAVAADERRTVGEDDSSNLMLQASPSLAELSSVQALQEMFEALQEIPSYGLGYDEVKAYRILNSDHGHRLRSLLRLPKDMRKDWLLMEIKVSDAC